MSALNGLARARWAMLLLAFGTASIPVWPAFISLAALTPPGVSLIPAVPAILDLVLCIVAAAIAAALLVREGALPPPLLRPILAYVASWALASALGFDPITGFLMTLALVMATVFYISIASWYVQPGVARAVYATFLATGTLVSILGIVLVVLRQPPALYALVHGRATATFVVPGEFAGYLLLLIPTALGVARVTASSLFRGLAIAAALTGTVALAETYSRAGWLGAAVGTAFFLYTQRGNTQRGNTQRRWSRGGAIAGAGIATALAAGVAAIAVYEGHHNPSEDFARLAIWRAGLGAIQLFPLTGVGPGAFRHVYPLLRPVSSEPFAFHVHNQLLTALAETGVLGTAALLVLWWRFIALFRAALRTASPQYRTLALAVASGLVATWAQGMLDFVQVVVLGCWLPFMALALGAARYGLRET